MISFESLLQLIYFRVFFIFSYFNMIYLKKKYSINFFFSQLFFVGLFQVLFILNAILFFDQNRYYYFLQGPPEKPGIYIQSTKAGKLAREVGLQTGDQIVHCNGIDFLNIPFGDAVFHLKVRALEFSSLRIKQVQK